MNLECALTDCERQRNYMRSLEQENSLLKLNQ